MKIEWDIPVTMSDGVELRANVFRPDDAGTYPALISCGPYGKDLHFEDGYASRWQVLQQFYPDAVSGTSNDHACWEVVDPEKWVPHGYAVVRVDSRGAGRSPGVIDHWSPRETADLVEAIEWVGAQAWCTGKVGMNGVSYYAMNAWQAAAHDPAPEHLAAVCVWEGCSDLYRELMYHGGIRHSFLPKWSPRQVENVQHGAPSGAVGRVSGLRVTGDVELSDEERSANRVDVADTIRAHPLLDDFYRERSARLERVRVPLLSAGNWGGNALHLRGNVEGFLAATSEAKWLEIHGHEHWAEFYTDYGLDLQRRFFDYFLKGEGDWADEQPAVQLMVRRWDDTYVPRAEHEWPLARTSWQSWHLDAARSTLSPHAPTTEATAGYRPLEDGLTYWSEPFAEDVEITGPVSATVYLSSESTDADLFLVLRAFGEDGSEFLFRGASDPFTPMAQGWLRASHRALDPERSTPYRPVHTHQAVDPLVPGQIYRLEVEIWPTCLQLPRGARIALSVQGRDYDHGLTDAEMQASGRPIVSWAPTRGCGSFTHEEQDDRPEDVYGARVTIHTGPEHPSSVLLPFVPRRLEDGLDEGRG